LFRAQPRSKHRSETVLMRVCVSRESEIDSSRDWCGGSQVWSVADRQQAWTSKLFWSRPFPLDHEKRGSTTHILLLYTLARRKQPTAPSFASYHTLFWVPLACQCHSSPSDLSTPKAGGCKHQSVALPNQSTRTKAVKRLAPPTRPAQLPSVHSLDHIRMASS
jgi:hypothetical protein